MKNRKEREERMEKNLEKKKVVDKRSVKLESVMRPDYIPFLSGRPNRETVIGKDDLMNVAIMLNTTNTVEEVIKSL
jgi:hypothetical protein